MSEKDKQIARSIAQAAKELPEAKREYILGLADGIALAKKEKQREE